jgi:hypothetical protein
MADFEVLLVLSGETGYDLTNWRASGLDVSTIPTDKNNYCSKRNLGAKVAQGGILAYIDDDAHATSGWIDAISRGFRAEWKMAGGTVEPEFEGEIPEELNGYERLIGGFNALPVSEYRTKTIMGCNMFLNREWLLDSGGFDEFIGAMNDITPRVFHGGDETDMIRKTEPDRIGFIEDARVSHFIQQNRINKEYILARSYGNGAAKKYIDSKYDENSFNRGHLLKTYVKTIISFGALKKIRQLKYLQGYFDESHRPQVL